MPVSACPDPSSIIRTSPVVRQPRSRSACRFPAIHTVEGSCHHPDRIQRGSRRTRPMCPRILPVLAVNPSSRLLLAECPGLEGISLSNSTCSAAHVACSSGAVADLAWPFRRRILRRPLRSGARLAERDGQSVGLQELGWARWQPPVAQSVLGSRATSDCAHRGRQLRLVRRVRRPPVSEGKAHLGRDKPCPRSLTLPVAKLLSVADTAPLSRVDPKRMPTLRSGVPASRVQNRRAFSGTTGWPCASHRCTATESTFSMVAGGLMARRSPESIFGSFRRLRMVPCYGAPASRSPMSRGRLCGGFELILVSFRPAFQRIVVARLVVREQVALSSVSRPYPCPP